MSDLISRQAAIDFIDAGHLANPNEPRWSDNEVVAFLRSRPPAQPEQRWISCKKRLPKELQEVYTTVYWNDYGDYITAYGMRTKFGWYLTSASEGELIKGYTVIAWMPLPEPWKGEQPC